MTFINPSHAEFTPTLSGHSLAQNLEAQLAAHESVNEALKQLRQSVMVGKTEAVKSANHRLVQLSDTMIRLETERQQLLTKAGYTTVPLRQLMQALPASEQQNLGVLRDKLNRTIRQVRIEQEDTQSVLNHSIQWVNQTVAGIAKALQPDPAKQNYGPPKPKKYATPTLELPLAVNPNSTSSLPFSSLQSSSYSKSHATYPLTQLGGNGSTLSSQTTKSLESPSETSIIERTA